MEKKKGERNSKKNLEKGLYLSNLRLSGIVVSIYQKGVDYKKIEKEIGVLIEQLKKERKKAEVLAEKKSKVRMKNKKKK